MVPAGGDIRHAERIAMASRVHLPLDTRRLTAAPDRIKRWRAHLQRLGTRLVLWRLLWLPFWIGGEMPAPWLPKRPEPGPEPDTQAARAVTGALDAIGRRIWWNTLLAAIARGLWLPFALGSIVALVQIVRDRDWSPERFVWVWAITIPLAMLLAYLLRPDRLRVATMLDQTFSLRDRMTTAMESINQPAATSQRAPLPYLQLADAANVAIGLKADPRFRLHLPSREISLAIMTGLFMMAVLFLRGVGGGLPELGESQVPAFVPAAERRTAAAEESYADPNQRPPTLEEVQASAELSQDAQVALNALADALDDNALTQPAADAIRAGDYETAAQILRDVAAQAGTLPPESREELAGALDEAAAGMQESSPSLSNAAGAASEGLQQGGEAAQSGMQDLGDAVELAGESVVPQEVLADQMQQAQQSAANQQGADAAQAPNQSSGQQGGAGQSDPNPSNQNGGEPGDPGSASNSSGADARPGSADQGEQQSSQSGEQEGSSESAMSGSESQSGAESQPGDQSQTGADAQGSGEQAGEAESGGDAQGGSQNPSDQQAEPGTTSGGEDSISDQSQSQGGGASGASQQTPSASEQDSEGAGAAGQQTPEAAPTGTSVAAAPTPSGAGAAPTTVPDSAVELDDQGGGESIQLGGGGSASSLGSGAGVMVAGGEATQAPVATAGPQSNRVPDDYRSIVENYFSRDGS
jgi:hypothetical protein